MSTEVRVPKLGITEDDAVLVAWLKGEGDTVDAGEALATLETDKASYDLESPAAGVVAQLLIAAGQQVKVGAVLGLVASHEEWESKDVGSPAAVEAAPPTEAAPPAETATPTEPGSSPVGGDRSPETGPIRATPRARRLAAERGFDLHAIKGSGPNGTITQDDVMSVGSGAAPTDTVRPKPGASSTSDEIARELPLSRAQQITARRTAQAFSSTPHFWLTSESDAEQLLQVVESLNAAPASTNRVTITDVIIAVCARALLQHPRVNASWVSDRVLGSESVNIGLATAVADGLLVTVLHDVGHASIRSISAKRADMIERARGGHARLGELEGATFTISNLGVFGVDQAMGILNPPGSALLFVGAIKKKPVVVEERIEARAGVTLTLAGDHRVLDGASGGAFLMAVRTGLENVSEEALGVTDHVD